MRHGGLLLSALFAASLAIGCEDVSGPSYLAGVYRLIALSGREPPGVTATDSSGDLVLLDGSLQLDAAGEFEMGFSFARSTGGRALTDSGGVSCWGPYHVAGRAIVAQCGRITTTGSLLGTLPMVGPWQVQRITIALADSGSLGGLFPHTSTLVFERP